MIVRTWSARATETGADNCHTYFEKTSLPQLRELPGFMGGYLLSRNEDGLVEPTTHTQWESPDSIHAFAGDDITSAIVESEALAFLETSDPIAVPRTVLIGMYG